MNKKERKNRILARGEFSDHCHTITGDATITRNAKGEVIVEIGNEECVLRHLLESAWMEHGKEVWTGEHHDINLTEHDSKVDIGQYIGRHGDIALKKVGDRKYKYVHQTVFDPLTRRIENARD